MGFFLFSWFADQHVITQMPSSLGIQSASLMYSIKSTFFNIYKILCRWMNLVKWSGGTAISPLPLISLRCVR